MWFAYLLHRFNHKIASLQGQGGETRSQDPHSEASASESARNQPKPEGTNRHRQHESEQSAADNLDKSAADVSTLGLSSFFDK